MLLSGLLAVVITAIILLLDRVVLSDMIIGFLKEIRGTAHYQGESKGAETTFIVAWIIFPIAYFGIAVSLLTKSLKSDNS